MTASAARLVALVRPVVEATGCDLEGLTVTAAGRRSVVRILVDRDGGVRLDDVAELSRALGDTLDAVDEAEPSLLGSSYVLEVSSPGVDRPLTEPRHWRRNVGRLVTATVRQGPTLTGRVVSADEGGLTLDLDGAERRLAYPEIAGGAVQVEFSRPNEGDA
ncbi:MAG: ribosome maturation factor RimP [Mycobacteriales bacterium]